jgi:hypothetical protein
MFIADSPSGDVLLGREGGRKGLTNFAVLGSVCRKGASSLKATMTCTGMTCAFLVDFLVAGGNHTRCMHKVAQTRRSHGLLNLGGHIP